MGTSKILIDGAGIDLTQDTVAANKMLSGTKAHDSNGDGITGSIPTYTGTQASGVIPITTNGEYDVTQFASAAVNVVPSDIRRWDITVASDIGQTEAVLIASDSWIANHYADTNLIMVLATKDLTSTGVARSVWIIGTNVKFAGFAGVLARRDASTGGGIVQSYHQLSYGQSYINCLRVTSAGDVRVAVLGTYPLISGDYVLAAFLL